MILKMKIKIIIDVLMVTLLPVLMAFQITGQEIHEWLGAGMLVLFLAHNILNRKWYKMLFNEKYTSLRVLQTGLDILILFSVFCLAYSGIIMSGYVFSFVSISGQMALARQMHMAASYWGFVLMSVHLGFHWGMIMGMIGKGFRDRKLPKAFPCALRIIAVIIAGYGAVCFHRTNMVSYLFLQTRFAFFDFGHSGILIYMENIAMMGLWVFAGYYVTKGIKKLFSVNKKVSILRKGDSHENN